MRATATPATRMCPARAGTLALMPMLLCAIAMRAQPFLFHHAVAPPAGSEFSEGKLGWSMAVSDAHVACGSPLAGAQGRVLVWNKQGLVSGSDLSCSVIDDPGPGLPGLFGASLACQGTALAVGHCSALDAGYCDDAADRVSLFEFDGATWTAMPNIERPAWVHGTFGHALALHGDHLAIGAYRSNEIGAEFPIVYLFHRTDGAWPALPTDSLEGATDGADRFGTAMSMDGEHLLIGAYRDDELGDHAGAAYIYRLAADSAEHWTLVRKLLASNGSANDGFGRAVALDGDQCVAGAPFRPMDTAIAGAAYHFGRDQGFPDNWGETAMLAPSAPRDGMGFGESLALRNDVLAVGAPTDVLSFPGQSGSIEVFRYNGNDWTAAQQLSPTDEGVVSVSSQCARSLELTDGALLVGAPWAWIPGQTTATSGGLLVYAQEPVGVAEQQEAQLLLWPVPANERLFIRLPVSTAGALRCTVQDALGRSIDFAAASSGTGTLSFPISALRPGIWWLTVAEAKSGHVIARASFVRE